MEPLNQKDWIWWKHGVIYHIYPRSFMDSNDDGVGDLRGIIQKLDYLDDLGIDAVWLSPVYKSPMVDFGYDVTDYCSIDPIFGTMEDFKELLEEAHSRDIRVIIDMVLNHTSDQHPWFIESRSSIDNPKRDWYIWRSGNDRNRPNNWRSAFGKSAWTLDQSTGEYYLHTFFKEQPDLNWRNKEVRKTFEKIFRFWLDLGVDGFRLDVINMIVKDKKFRNNPGLLMGVFRKKRWYTRNQSKSFKIVRQLRKVLDEYNQRMMVGEVYTLPPGDAELAGRYLDTGENAMHMSFDFSLMFKPWSARKYYRTLKKWHASIPDKGWPCHVLSNHDLRRISRQFRSTTGKADQAKVAAMLLLTVRGTPFIYYGEEIGMQNGRLKKEELQDPLGKRFWPFFKGRDKTRTPMQWNSEPYAGFSKSKPWLPVNKDFPERNAQIQQKQADSLLSFYRLLIGLRKKHRALRTGIMEEQEKGNRGVLSYIRKDQQETLLIVLNFTPYKRRYRFPSKDRYRVLLSSHRPEVSIHSLGNHVLFPYEATVFCESSPVP